MAYKDKLDLQTDKTIALGGKNKEGKPNPTQIEGYYLGAKSVDGDFGPAKLHIFQTEAGNVGVWGKSRLNTLLTGELKGQMVEATFTGLGVAQKGKKPPYLYKVRYDEDNRIDIAGLDVEVAAEEPQYEESYEDVDPETDEAPLDEIKPARPVAARSATAPVNKVGHKTLQDVLNARKSS